MSNSDKLKNCSDLCLFVLQIKLQLQFYFTALGKTLRHYRLWIFLFVALVVFGINEVFDPVCLGLPLFIGTSPGAAPDQVIGVVILTQALGAFWYFAQAPFLEYKPFEEYVNTLPISRVSASFKQLIVLCVANFLLWIPVIFAVWFIFKAHGATTLDRWVSLIRLDALCWLMVLCQFCLFTKQYRKFIWIILLDLGFIFSNAFPIYLNLASIVVLDLIGLWLCFGKGAISSKQKTKVKTSRKKLIDEPWGLSTTCIVQHQVVRLYAANFMMRLSLVVVLQALLYESLRHVATNTGHLPWDYLVIFNGFSALVLSGFAKSFYLEHQKAWPYTSTLPLSKWHWLWCDYLYLLTILLFLQLPILAYTMVHFNQWRLLDLVLFIALQMMLMFGLTVINRTSWPSRAQVFAIIIWVLLLMYIPLVTFY